MHYLCSVCHKEVEKDLMVYQSHMEKHIVDLVRQDHPQWAEVNGMCQLCYDYYKNELKGGIFGDVPCAMRRRMTRGWWQNILKIFKGGSS